MPENILENILTIEKRIVEACRKTGRTRESVRLLLATKTVPADRIKIALEAGFTLIAENKIQEVKEKFDDLKDIVHSSHFIGHLQSNKVKELLKYNISCLQSLDRLSLAEKLHQRLRLENKTLEVLIQVNTSGEESKFGILPKEAIHLITRVAKFDTLRIKGLMTIGLFSSEEEKVRACFQELKRLQLEVKSLDIPNVEMTELSMGMSGDLEIAIEEGATIVRVGTAVFGQRAYPDSYYWNENAR